MARGLRFAGLISFFIRPVEASWIGPVTSFSLMAGVDHAVGGRGDLLVGPASRRGFSVFGPLIIDGSLQNHRGSNHFGFLIFLSSAFCVSMAGALDSVKYVVPSVGILLSSTGPGSKLYFNDVFN